ncbi:MAG: sigma-70 family RNA polymerase sigma factor, partial [Lachnospiraceae bacterium]|nr:sigma-70 family RNA polymerase sigma factor [Lachnospiraceae bacterium]
SQMAVTNVVSLNEFNENSSDEGSAERETIASNEPGPEDVVEQAELKKMLADALELLTDRERKVILLYYYEELTLKEISNVLEVSESRVSQLHIKALKKMKEKLGKYMGYITNSK